MYFQIYLKYKRVIIYLGSNPRIPAAVIVGPKPKLPETGHRKEDVLLHISGAVERIYELICVAIDKGPKRHGLLLHFLFKALLLPDNLKDI